MFFNVNNWNEILKQITWILLGFFVSGIKEKEHGQILKKLFQADYFRIVVCDDEDTVEICGALKVNHKL